MYGVPTSLTNLVDRFNNVEYVPVQSRTIAAYIKLLENAKILYECARFDLVSLRSTRSCRSGRACGI